MAVYHFFFNYNTHLTVWFYIAVVFMHFSHQYAAREAEIVAQAGRKFAITISTNMAGRGTDIILGGNPKVSAFFLVNLF